MIMVVKRKYHDPAHKPLPSLPDARVQKRGAYLWDSTIIKDLCAVRTIHRLLEEGWFKFKHFLLIIPFLVYFYVTEYQCIMLSLIIPFLRYLDEILNSEV